MEAGPTLADPPPMQQIENHPAGEAAQAAEKVSARPRPRAPFMTLALIGVNFLMAFAQVAASGGQAVEKSLGTVPAKWAMGAKITTLVAHGEYWRLVTASFLHDSPSHLLGNMLLLLLLGWMVETFYGPARLLVIYLLGAVAGVVGSYLLTPGESLGASTGVAALIGAMLVHNAKYRPYLPPRLNRMFPLLLLFVVFTLMLGGPENLVDFQGHMWGLAGGGLMAALLESRIAGAQQGERDWLPLPTALATVSALLLYGGLGLLLALPGEMSMLRAARSRNPAAVAGNLQTLVAARPYFLEGRAALAEELAQAGNLSEGDRVYDSLLQQNPKNGYLRSRAGLYHFAAARTQDEGGHWDEAAERYRRAADLFEESPARTQAENAYAWTLADHLHRDLDSALQYALRAAEAEPQSGAIADTVAWIYYGQGRYAAALAQQQRAIRLWKNPVSRWLDGDDPRATTATGAELFYHLGAIQEELHQTADARQSYRTALQLKPGDPKADAALRKLVEPHTEPAGPGRELTPRLIVPKRDDPTTI